MGEYSEGSGPEGGDPTSCSLEPGGGSGPGEGDGLVFPHLPLPWSLLQSEAKWTMKVAELERERSSLASTVALREEELVTLREQLAGTQLKLASTQARRGHHRG